MIDEEINTLREEAAPVELSEAEITPPAPVLPDADPALCQTMSMVVAGLSVPICRKARVTGLGKHEADMLGAAIAQLVAVYDLGPKDPKGAAWMGLGLCCVGVVSARARLPDAPPEAVAAVEVPPAPVFGSLGNTSLGIVATDLPANAA